MKFIEVESTVAPRVARMARGMEATRGLELATGMHRRSTAALLRDTRDVLTDTECDAFAACAKDANASKT